MQPTLRARGALAVVILAAAVMAAGCGSYLRNCPACDTPPPVEPCGSDLATIGSTLFTRTLSTAPSILFLSAGGSWGAWGAGVLKGWGPNGRPTFDLVTGSSTGAIQATFALLGNHDPTLANIYTTKSNKDVFKRRPLLLIPFRNSVNTLDPLRASLKAAITPAMVQEVKDAYLNEGRQIWIGTTDLDTGEFCNWNLSEVAASGDYDKYIELIVASCANPGVFEVIDIDGALHADGGVRHQLYTHVIEGAVEAYAALATKPAGTPTAYAIVNGQLVVRRQCVPDQIAFVLMRSSSILSNEALAGDLAQAEHVLSTSTPPWALKTSQVPLSYPLWPTPDQFEPTHMSNVFALGEGAGANPAHWVAGVPPPATSPAPCVPPL